MSTENPSPPAGEDEQATDGMAARKASLALLEDVLQRKQALDHALANQNAFKALPQRDRALVRMLVTTCLRRMGQVDDLIERAMNRDTPRNMTLQNILRIGVTQILFMEVADHAAVDTSVRLAEEQRMEKQKAFVNGVLRTITREGVGWKHKQDETQKLSDLNYYIANHDHMTGLPNRRNFFRQLRERLQRA